MVSKRRICALAIATAAGAVSLGIHSTANASGDCPAGGDWFLEWAQSGDLYDANGDGLICTKVVNGDGQGNSANSQRGSGQTGFHVDGHNHKDNTN